MRVRVRVGVRVGGCEGEGEGDGVVMNLGELRIDRFFSLCVRQKSS